MAITSETEFELELRIFGNDVNEAIRCFYVWLTFHVAARKNQKVYRFLNRSAGFWNVAIGSIQANSLIALGRIFDKRRDSHNVNRLLKLAETNISIFSAAGLRQRVEKRSGNSDVWIDEIVKNAYIPTTADFKRLKLFVDARRKVYASSYKQLRDKAYAHKERTDISGFVARTNTRELGRLLSAMQHLHHVLWNLLHNGARIRLHPFRHSEGRRIQQETRNFLKSLTKG